MIVGEGKFRYEVVVGWEQLPKGWSHGDVAGVATDSHDRVYVFNRSEHPVIVYEPDGRFLSTWGDNKTYPRPHGITIINDVVYLADDTDHTVRTCTLDGKILMTLGTSGKPSDTGYVASAPYNLTTITRAAGPFNRPTRLSIGSNGDLFVSDGYGNARVHRFSPDGKLLQSWGWPGEEPGQFHLPHSVWAHTEPVTYASADAPEGTAVALVVEGECGGRWTVVRGPSDGWELFEGIPETSAATVRMLPDTAWRLFTKQIEPDQALPRVMIEGDAALGRRLLGTVSIIA